MKKLLMLLIVLALSLPAYANDYNILVYKTTMTGPRFAEDGVKKAKVRGYLVLEVYADATSNLENGHGLAVEGGQILYVKDGRQKLGSSYGSDGTMFYYQPGKKKGTILSQQTHFYYLGTHQGEMKTAAYGRVRRVFIGTGKPKPRIPTKLKGHVRVDGHWQGACRLTMKLASKRTKNANKQDKTVDQVVEELENRLERKGYTLPD